MYHVMSRGDRRENIFLTDVDRHDFIKTLAEACEKTGWQVHAYCLMRNHYHLVKGSTHRLVRLFIGFGFGGTRFSAIDEAEHWHPWRSPNARAGRWL